tara:strand:+ start:1573 stop:2694 length:1122 start_codon:yes stop_codon:yes gene_type:complete
MAKENTNLFVSITILSITLLMMSQAIGSTVIKPRLYDGTINELGRYAFTFDAYEYIEQNSEDAVIAIGSSKMREIFDGLQIGNSTSSSNDFFNLAYAGDRPYVRMIEIDAIIRTNPKMVIMEMGPNVLSSLSTPIPDSIIGRMAQLMSLNSEWSEQSWNEIILEEDREILPMTKLEQIRHHANYTPEALESTLNYEFELQEQPYSCDRETGTVRCVPLSDSTDYEQYIRYPIQFRNSLKSIKEGNSKWTIDEFYGAKLDSYLAGSYHNPEGKINKNQIAFEFMIERLIENEIEVMLVGLPYNPVLIDRLSEHQWDYYNATIEQYRLQYDIAIIDYLWNEDWIEEDFNDYTHASREGELKFAEKISPHIDEILS